MWVLTFPFAGKQVPCGDHSACNYLGLWFSDFVQLFVLRGFEKNSDLRSVEPAHMAQVGRTVKRRVWN